MKKRSGLFIVIPIIVCLIFTSFTTAQAAPLQNDPVITVISGGSALQTTIIPLEQLPGSIAGSAGSILPGDSPKGEYQFSGDGIQVKGLNGGSALLCFTVEAPAAGWISTIHRWTGSTWESVETSTTVDEEGINPKACATIYFDGTFAVIMSYQAPEGKVLKECANILSIGPDVNWNFGSDTIYIEGGYVYPGIDVGSKVRYQLLYINPKGTIIGDLSAEGVVVNNISIGPGPTDFYSYVVFPEGTTLTNTADWWNESSFTVRFFFQGCYKDFHWPSDFS
jgi:hypothetical protein